MLEYKTLMIGLSRLVEHQLEARMTQAWLARGIGCKFLTRPAKSGDEIWTNKMRGLNLTSLTHLLVLTVASLFNNSLRLPITPPPYVLTSLIW